MLLLTSASAVTLFLIRIACRSSLLCLLSLTCPANPCKGSLVDQRVGDDDGLSFFIDKGHMTPGDVSHNPGIEPDPDGVTRLDESSEAYLQTANQISDGILEAER